MKAYFDYVSDVLEFANHIFMPKVIANKIKVLSMEVLTIINEELSDSFLVVSNVSIINDEIFEFGQKNNEQIDFMRFVTEWDDLIKEIQKWLSANASRKCELNL